MISKLIAWAEDRPSAIARMRRALDEYVISGIKTTLPFFAWLLAKPEFAEGRFHTGYLDEVLAQRNGRPFVEPTADQEELAAIAAAIYAAFPPARPSGDAAAGVERRWKVQARAEGLRD
jgi:acetyl/propionyl-CoA carboxylase alpha subunit